MLVLVAQHRKELLVDTYLHLARQFEHENNLKGGVQIILLCWPSTIIVEQYYCTICYS